MLKWLSVFSFVFLISVNANDWELVKVRNGISVYKRKNDSSNLVTFRGVGKIDAPILKVANVILDPNRHQTWAEDVKETKIVKWIAKPNEYIEYNHVKLPLFISNRDFIQKVRVETSLEDKSVKVSYHRYEDSKDFSSHQKKDNILGELNGSFYKMTSIEDGKATYIEGVVTCDPRGDLPKWVVNFFQSDWPHDTIQNIRKAVSKIKNVDEPRFAKIFE